MCFTVPILKPHPLKAPLLKHLRLWQIRKLLGGSPSEAQLSRFLNCIDTMPADLEARLDALLRGVSE